MARIRQSYPESRYDFQVKQLKPISVVRISLGKNLVLYKVLLKLFCRSQFPQKFVNPFLILVIVKDKLTDLWGGFLLHNDFTENIV